MNDDLKLPKIYKTVLMLALVFGPFFWLAFTEDGQRRTDLAMMFVFGKPEFNAALDAFNSGLTEDLIRERFPKLEFQCADGVNPFGDRLCGAEIGSFNQIPSSSATLFIADGRLRGVKILYRRAYHPLIRDWVERRVAAHPDPGWTTAPPSEAPVATARVQDGALFIRAGELTDTDEPALLWLSQAAIEARR